MNNFEEYIKNSFNIYKDNVLKEAMIYCMDGGKRFRPSIMFAIEKGFGQNEEIAYAKACSFISRKSSSLFFSLNFLESFISSLT